MYDTINELLIKYDESDELEIRVGSFNEYFKASVSEDLYNVFLDYFNKNSDYKLDIKRQIIWFYNNRIKKIFDLDTKNTYFVKKNLKHLLDFRNENVRIALNKEIFIDNIENFENNYQYVNKRVRNSYMKYDKSLKIDISFDVNSILTHKIYYIEFEFLKKPKYEYVISILEMIKKIKGMTK